jgi:beta-lactamase superfamily II metal-dependent hydrolase
MKDKYGYTLLDGPDCYTMNYKRLSAVLTLSLGFFFPATAARTYAAPALDALTVAAGDALPVLPDIGSPQPVRPPLKAQRPLNAWFINVWQGDSEYLELPNGRSVLIDGGPANPSGTGDPLVAQFLTQHGITHIDYVVLTHPHADHFTGLKYVFDHVKVDNFYDTREENPGAATLKVLRDQIAGNHTTAINYPAADDTLDWDPGEVQVKVLNSCSTPGQSTVGQVLNNCSIVLKVTYQNVSMLFTGDIQSDIEAQLAAKYGAELQADVLKVGHHGSATASSVPFLSLVKPRYAYIEVGAHNSFGHPTQAALSRLQATGAKIFRTDLDGTQEYSIGR